VTCVAWLPRPVAAISINHPVTAVSNLLLTGFMIVLLIVAIRYHRRVLFLLTGEEHVRIQIADACWITFCRCGGFCDGEWTRCVSAVCCFWHKGLRGANLKRILGQMLGILPIPIRVSNIVVGDLPTHSNTSDFYVSIEVGTNPNQITSVAEDFHPKVVHFNETMTLRVKFTPMESNIRFVVKELGTLGSSELCECYINPMLMLKWRYLQSGPMRFRMDPCERHGDGVFPLPPWILLELGVEQEWMPETPKIRVMEMGSSNAREFTPREFKSKYTLLNTFGMRTHEPDENKVGALDKTKRLRTSVNQCHLFSVLLISTIFFVARYYCFTCYRGFVHVEVLNSHHLIFPVPQIIKDQYLEQCAFDKRMRPFTMTGDMIASVMEFSSELQQKRIRVWRAEAATHMSLADSVNATLAHALRQAPSSIAARVSALHSAARSAVSSAAGYTTAPPWPPTTSPRAASSGGSGSGRRRRCRPSPRR